MTALLPAHHASTALVTGASSGLGRACVDRFAAAGWNVVASMRDPRADSGITVPERIARIKLDVTDEKSIVSAIETGIERFGGIDAVINNAGFGIRGVFETIPQEEVRRQFDVNLFGVMNVCRAALPHLRSRRSGVIVNVSSAAGAVGLPLASIYAASKFALEGFTEALAYELLSQNIVIKLVEPGGMTGTNFLATSSRDIAGASRIADYSNFLLRAEEVYQRMGRGPTASAADVAEVVFLAATDGTDQLRYVATDDIRPLMRLRREASETEYIAKMRERFPGRE